jgi:hypothetical protein
MKIMKKITSISVRMYRMGTGDCFILKFLSGDEVNYKMMIDCGTWSGTVQTISKHVSDIKTYVDGHLDLLVVTHEHKDHVYGFEVCNESHFKDFTIDRTWMGWTEDERNPKVKAWQKDYGQKKKALSNVSRKLKEIPEDPVNKAFLAKQFNGSAVLSSQQKFAEAINEFNDLHNSLDDNYVGGMEGMKIVKDTLSKNKIDYFEPGDIIRKIPNLEGVKFYVLGPPKSWAGEVKVQEGPEGESYRHNKELAPFDSFAAVLMADSDFTEERNPFDSHHNADVNAVTSKLYNDSEHEWRNIDNEWLNSAGSFALRINSITNNLSLAFAIEFEDSGKVLLFPGDAEYGSWRSWHQIPWKEKPRNENLHFTEDLLRRTVFYKVAHHISHNGTAQRLGMEMLTHPDLVAMATLDYNVISSTWKGTMPNRALIKALVTQAKGRVIIMNEEGLFYNPQNTIKLTDAILKERSKMSRADADLFETSYQSTDLYHQYVVSG